MLENLNLDNKGSGEKFEVVNMPKRVWGSYREKAGEAGVICCTSNFYEEAGDIIEIYNILNYIPDRRVNKDSDKPSSTAILIPFGEKIFFGMKSPGYTCFPDLNREYSQSCLTFTRSDNPSAGNLFSHSKMFDQYSKENNIEQKNEVVIGKGVGIPEKLFSTIQEYLQNKKNLYIENDKDIKLVGNEILDYEPVKILLNIYDKLPYSLKEEYSLCIGTFASTYKPIFRIGMSLKPLSDQEKTSFEKMGFDIKYSSDLF